MNQLFKQRIAFRKYGERMVSHARGAQLLLTPEAREKIRLFIQEVQPDDYKLSESDAEFVKMLSVTFISLVLNEEFDAVSALTKTLYVSGRE